ncbi:hypothetical protein Tco_0800278 [Tanacetum coccineum]|uniref:DUF1985 domain-containing protein n=1 Tax=Tanacetum coccineum TaxID=301880 RepID=A0ABQ4ZWF1_9ASTR
MSRCQKWCGSYTERSRMQKKAEKHHSSDRKGVGLRNVAPASDGKGVARPIERDFGVMVCRDLMEGRGDHTGTFDEFLWLYLLGLLYIGRMYGHAALDLDVGEFCLWVLAGLSSQDLALGLFSSSALSSTSSVLPTLFRLQHRFLEPGRDLLGADEIYLMSPHTGYVTKSDLKEDIQRSNEDDETRRMVQFDYPCDEWRMMARMKDGDSSRDDADDEDEDKEDKVEEEEEHPALADSAVVIPTVELVSLPEGTEPIIPPPLYVDISNL